MSQATKMVKHSTIYAVGNISRQLVGFIMLPVYTRFLSPADYGVIGLLVFLVSLVELLFGGHMFNAVPKYYYEQKSEQARKRLISSALIITAITSGITVSCVMLLSTQASSLLFGSTEYSTALAMFSIVVLTNALENYALIYIRIQQKPWLFVGLSLSKLVLQLSLNLYFIVYLNWGVLGVAASAMCSSLLFATYLTIRTVRQTGISFEKKISITLFKFSLPLWIGGIAGLYIGSANRYFIRIFSSLDDVGLFELATKFSSIIFLLIWTPFLQYWQTERFRIYKQKNAIATYQTVFKIATVALIVPAIAISLFSDVVIHIMAAEDFYPSSNAAPFLIFSVVFYCLTIFNNFSFLVKEKTGWMSKNSYLTAAIVTIFYFALIPEYGFVGAAIATMAANIIQFFIVFYASKKFYDMELQLSNLFSLSLVACLSLSVAYLFDADNLLTNILYRSINLCVVMLAVFLVILRDSTLRKILVNLADGLKMKMKHRGKKSISDSA
ncbi:lipopolysaccharide biosynthesis protein [Teredinibacter franksiae]|uniref:lipopolysaccharide biosynthesis protein n=1 Tax=Teredinibacter franksiae TaxID=2761453 RepID=UPI001C8A6CFC|nr:oligosaccharide flippase family protein [Teredinibacter franksiae]